MINTICCMVIAVCCLVMAGNLDKKINDVIQGLDSFKGVLIGIDNKIDDCFSLINEVGTDE